MYCNRNGPTGTAPAVRTCAIFAVPRCLIDLVCLLLPITPDDRARENIDTLLTDAGLDRPGQARYQSVQPAEPWPGGTFRLKSGYGEADYLLFVDGHAHQSRRSQERRPHAYWRRAGVPARQAEAEARAELPQAVKSLPIWKQGFIFLVPVLVSVGFQMSCQSVLEGSKKEPHEILASIGRLASCAKLSESVRRSQN
jgi:hypothetical protein